MSSSAYLIPPERYAQPQFVLRCRRPGDGAAVSEAINASYEHLKTFMAWAKPEQSVERSEQLSREFHAKWLQATDFPLAIWDQQEARILGGCGYHLREGPLELGNAEIGMWIRADAAGAGLGTAALGALLRWGFSEWPWLRLSWRCSSANLASQRVAEKAGLQREGVLRSHAIDPGGLRRDTICYAILRDEWLAQAQP
ncbi:MAG TPA: GNAT family protein [Polyangiaceae bacterium]|nr:GNAT family protein [Polyangiaceae bacterium]